MKAATETLGADTSESEIERKARLVGSIERWLWAEANRIAANYRMPDSADEIFAVGRVQALAACGTYDAALGASFLGYCSRHCRHRMCAAAVALKQPVHTPLHKRFDGLAFAVPLDAPASDRENADTIGDSFIDEAAPDPCERTDTAAQIDTMQRHLARLTKKERLVLHERFWNDRTLESIGADLGVTRERIRQIQLRALIRLRRFAAEERGSAE